MKDGWAVDQQIVYDFVRGSEPSEDLDLDGEQAEADIRRLATH